MLIHRGEHELFNLCSTTPKYIFTGYSPKGKFKKCIRPKKKNIQNAGCGQKKKKKEAECCNNCVYSPLTILGNKELNEREKK